jgi:cyanophycinase
MTKRKNNEPHGHLFIIGGAEDREEDKLVLSRFVELAGGTDARIAVLTAASN